jgi:protein ImuA
MQAEKRDIINQLQQDIRALQGFKRPVAGTELDVGLGEINAAFPNASFPLSAVHEFVCTQQEDVAATTGFIAGLIGAMMRTGGACIWISSCRLVFPPAFRLFGIEPDRIIFIDLKKENDVLWAMEEALKCGGLAAVVGELQEISFTASRRLQLAVEQSRVTGFILRRSTRKLNITACVSRWKISSMPSEPEDDLPGIGFPRWNVELLKIRNGKPGSWQLEWAEGRFRPVYPEIVSMPLVVKMKTG